MSTTVRLHDEEVSHQANNLLQAIVAEARLLSDRISSEADRARLERIADQAMVVADLLARSSGGAAARRADLSALIDAAIEVVDARARRAHVVVERDATPGLHVVARTSRLEHALVNLLVNAIQALDAPGVGASRRRVRVLARPGAAGRVRVVVRDEGPGVPAALRPLLLEVPVTTKAPAEGSGVGLLLVREIVEAHGGAVTLDSAPGEFTEVTLDLPAA